jgi:hypothetical protein
MPKTTTSLIPLHHAYQKHTPVDIPHTCLSYCHCGLLLCHADLAYGMLFTYEKAVRKWAKAQTPAIQTHVATYIKALKHHENSNQPGGYTNNQTWLAYCLSNNYGVPTK